MAPIVANPDDARPLTESAAAMRELAALPATVAALISGRALRDLATLSRMPAEVHLVGSHGSEFDTGFVHGIDESAKALLRKIKDALGAIAAEYPGRGDRDQARQHRAACAQRRAGRRRRGAEEGDGVCADVGCPDHRGQGGAGVRGDSDRQGPGARHPAAPAGRVRRGLLRRRRDRREGISAAARSRRRRQGRPRGHVGGLPDRVARGRRAGADLPARVPPHVAARWAFDAHRAVDDAVERPHRRAADPRGRRGVDVSSPGRLCGGVLETARRRERRSFRNRPGAGGAAAEPALRRRHHDRRNPLGQPAGHRLPVPRRRRGPHRSGPGDQRAGEGRGVVRATAGVRSGAGAPARRRRRASGVRHQRAHGVARPRRGMGDRRGRNPRNRPCGRSTRRRVRWSSNCVAVRRICPRARSTRIPAANGPRVTGGTGRRR